MNHESAIVRQEADEVDIPKNADPDIVIKGYLNRIPEQPIKLNQQGIDPLSNSMDPKDE